MKETIYETKCRGVDNSKMDLRITGWESVDRISVGLWHSIWW